MGTWNEHNELAESFIFLIEFFKSHRHKFSYKPEKQYHKILFLAVKSLSKGPLLQAMFFFLISIHKKVLYLCVFIYYTLAKETDVVMTGCYIENSSNQ